MADNAGAMPGLAVDAARAHGCDTVDELGFAYRAHFDRSGGARHGARLHEHGGEDVVAAARIRQQFVEQIAAVDVPLQDQGRPGLHLGRARAGARDQARGNERPHQEQALGDRHAPSRR